MMAFFFTNADQQNNTDKCHDAEFGLEQHQGEHRADTRRRQGGENGDRVNVALVQHAEHDVDRHQGGQNQVRLVERLFESPARCPGRYRGSRPARRAGSSPSFIAFAASLSEKPGARLNEMVEATNRPW